MRKKLIVYLLIVIIIVNTAIPNLVYAEEPSLGAELSPSGEEINDYLKENGQDAVDKAFNDSEATIKPDSGSRTVQIGETATSSSLTAEILSHIFTIFPSITNFLMTRVILIFQDKVTVNTILNTKDSHGNDISIPLSRQKDIKYFCIEDLVYNRYHVFDIDFFDFNNTAGPTATKGDIALANIKKSIASWYLSLRNVAIAANLMILIYIGIRMAISSVADDKAKYKKMLFNWAVSVVLIYMMQYIIVALFAMQDWAIEILNKFVYGEGFEEYIIKDTFAALKNAKGWSSVSVTITIWVLVYYELKFFLMYLQRMLSIGFLITVSPLITITYAIDAVGDGKSQVYTTWFKELVYNIFIQVIHAIIYTIFIWSAAEIVKQMPIMGAILFMMLSRTVNIVRTSLKLSSGITKSTSLLDRLKK